MRYVSIALLLMASASHAENWQQLASLDSNGGVLSVDAASITEVKGFRGAWFKAVYSSDRPIPDEYRHAVHDAPSYRSVQSMSFFNCPERTSAVAQYRWYGADDKAVGNLRLEQLAFHKVSPGTPDEQMLETVCGAEAVKPQVPLEEQARMTRPVNPDDYYPASSIRRGEQGAPVVQACVGPTGKLLREPVVTESSGFPDLDAAVIRAAKATRYRAGMRNGTALPESCITFRIKFALTKS